MAKQDIIQELNELESSLAVGFPRQIYAVPDGYFDDFASGVLARIKAINAADAVEELSHLSPLLGSASKELPYSVPEGYFSDLKNSVLEGVRNHADYQTAGEELESISPLLNSISRKSPYSVPGGYFENFQVDITPAKKEQANVISLSSRKWFRYAVAAVVIGFMAIGGILFFRPKSTIDVSNTHAWVEQNMKKVSTSDINNFIQQTSEVGIQNQAIASTVKPSDVKEMLKDVSDKDLQNFLSETEISEESSDDLFLN